MRHTITITVTLDTVIPEVWAEAFEDAVKGEFSSTMPLDTHRGEGITVTVAEGEPVAEPV